MGKHVYPGLRYKDADPSIDWLERAFGFKCDERHKDEGGRTVHAELHWGEHIVMAGEETPESVERFGSHIGQAWTYITVIDADAAFERAKDAGAEVVMGLTDTDYGSRDFTVKDPEGNMWSFSTYDPIG